MRRVILGLGSMFLILIFATQIFADDVLVPDELLNELLETIPEYITNMDETIRKNDAEALRELAHTLKGACYNLSAKTMAESSYAIELLAKENNLSQFTEKKKTLVQAYEQLKHCIESM